MQIGHLHDPAQNRLRTDILGRPAGIEVDAASVRQVYIADGVTMKQKSDRIRFGQRHVQAPVGCVRETNDDADPGRYDPKAPPDPVRNPVQACIFRGRLVSFRDRS